MFFKYINCNSEHFSILIRYDPNIAMKFEGIEAKINLTSL